MRDVLANNPLLAGLAAFAAIYCFALAIAALAWAFDRSDAHD